MGDHDEGWHRMTVTVHTRSRLRLRGKIGDGFRCRAAGMNESARLCAMLNEGE
jgi:hypothetical protein